MRCSRPNAICSVLCTMDCRLNCMFRPPARTPTTTVRSTIGLLCLSICARQCRPTNASGLSFEVGPCLSLAVPTPSASLPTIVSDGMPSPPLRRGGAAELGWFRNLLFVAYKSESLWRYLLLLLHLGPWPTAVIVERKGVPNEMTLAHLRPCHVHGVPAPRLAPLVERIAHEISFQCVLPTERKCLLRHTARRRGESKKALPAPVNFALQKYNTG